MLLSTEAPTMPSVTLSNYEPLTRLGIHYELLLARMSKTDKIELTDGHTHGRLSEGRGASSRVRARPGLVDRGQPDPDIRRRGGRRPVGRVTFCRRSSTRVRRRARASGREDVVGKQEASVTSRFLFPGPVPFAVYFEYAGNDTDAGRNYLLGKPDLSAGIHFPHIGPFDVTFENSYWAPDLVRPRL